jgi:hypothetical protein
MNHFLTPQGAAEVQAAIAAHRAHLAELRASRWKRHIAACAKIETAAALAGFRKAGESVLVAGQSFRTMEDRVEHTAIRASQTRFTGESPLSGFGEF